MQEKKDVVFRNNIKFPDNGLLDFKINGHPTVNITEECDEEIYFLRISSQIHQYVNNKDKMVLIKNSKYNGLSKPSVVKVDHILKEGYRNIIPAGALSNLDYNSVIDKLEEFRTNNCCTSHHCACNDYGSLQESEV